MAKRHTATRFGWAAPILIAAVLLAAWTSTLWLTPSVRGAALRGSAGLVSAPQASASLAGGTLGVSIVDPIGNIRVERNVTIPLRVLVSTPGRRLPATAVEVRLRNNVTGDESKPRLTPKVTVQVSVEDGGGWEHSFTGLLDARKLDFGQYAFTVIVTLRGQQVTGGVNVTVGIPLELATLIKQRLLPDYTPRFDELVTFDQAHSWASTAVSLYLNPANGRGYSTSDDPARENILEKVLGRPDWLPATANDSARASEIEKVLTAVSWRAHYYGNSFGLAKRATTDASSFTQAECAGKLEKEAPVLYQVAQRKAAIPQTLVNGVGLSMGLQPQSDTPAVLSLVVQRGYWRLYDVAGVRQPAFPVDRAKLLVTAASAPPDLFDEQSDFTHAQVAFKTVPANWSPKAIDWEWTAGALALGTTPATTDEPQTTGFKLPVKAILSPRSTATQSIFRAAVAVQVRGDEPGPGWPPKEAELKQSPLLCGWYRLAVGAGVGPGVQLIYHQKFRDDPCAIPDGDDDADGLPNLWECEKVKFPEGTLDLPALGASPRHKDLFLECDYMSKPGKNLQPTEDALDRVAAAFATAPLDNPDGRNGVLLHVDAGSVSANMPTGRQGNAIPYVEDWGGNPFTNGVFDTIKSANFKPVRRHAFHYCVFGNRYSADESSGIARGIPADDFVVTIGSPAWGAYPRTTLTQEQAGTLMHEFGHTLGLRHGGADDLNYKPNYLSIMTYAFQLTGLVRNGLAGALDYSRFEPSLDETHLVERDGIGGPPALDRFSTTWSCPDGSLRTDNRITQGLDWNCDGDLGDTVSQSVNQDAAKSVLESQQDWANLIYIGGSIGVGGRVPADKSAVALTEIGPAEAARVRAALAAGLLEDIAPPPDNR